MDLYGIYLLTYKIVVYYNIYERPFKTNIGGFTDEKV